MPTYATATTISNILAHQIATPAYIESAAANAMSKNKVDATLAAANAIQSLGSLMSKVVEDVFPPLLWANLLNDLYKTSTEGQSGHITDSTMMGAAVDITAAIAFLSFAALSAPVDIAIAAIVITAGAALTVLSTTRQTGESTAVSDSITTMLSSAIEFVATTGNELTDYFSQMGSTVDQGISSFVDKLNSIGEHLGGNLFDFTRKHPYCLAVRPPVTEYKAITTYGTYSYQETIPYDNDSDPDESGAAELAEGETKTVYVTGSYPIITYKRILKSPADPIILDLAGNGIQTVGLNAGIQFDINGSGVKQNTGWIGAANDELFELRRRG